MFSTLPESPSYLQLRSAPDNPPNVAFVPSVIALVRSCSYLQLQQLPVLRHVQ